MSRILMLHRVLPEYDPNNYYFQRQTAISWKKFNSLLDQLEEDGYHAMPLSALAKDSKDYVYLTFDDGYADNIRALEEILKRGMSATVFPVKQFTQRAFSSIDDMAFHLMKNSQVPAPLYRSLLTGRHKKILRRMSDKRYRHCRSHWFGVSKDAVPEGLFLSETQLANIVSKGIELGIHGCSHRVFTSLSSCHLKNELYEATEWLDSLGAKGAYPICFPHGTHDSRTVRLCSQSSQVMLGVDSEPSSSLVFRRKHIKENCSIELN